MIRTDVAHGLADALAAFRVDAVPPAVLHEAKRSLFNVLAVAVGASRHPGVDAILRVARRAGAGGRAAVVGRSVRVEPHFAALANGFAAHVDDYDDTHLATVIHPAAPVAATVLALAAKPVEIPTGAAAMGAFIAGCEVELRIGVALSPEHYDAGWHITGTCGTFGAAAAAALMLGYDAQRIAQALRFAATSASGAREAFGTMAKGYHAGKAAANGIRAAASATDGNAGAAGALEAFADAAAPGHRLAAMRADLAAPFELSANTYKPYPCGIVAHPLIDAAIAAAERVPSIDAIEAVVVRCNPLVEELMGRREPFDGLQARFSAVHGVAMGLRDRRVDLTSYADFVVNAPAIAALRARIRLAPDPQIARDAAELSVRLAGGATVEISVEHARGSLARPLTDAELGAKAVALLDSVLPGRANALRSAVSDWANAATCDALVAAVTP